MAINNQPRSFQTWVAITATPSDFNLDAGWYGLLLHATAWGTAQLQKFVPDGAGGGIYIAVSGVAQAADGYAVLILSAGQYRLVVAGVTALSGEIALISRGANR